MNAAERNAYVQERVEHAVLTPPSGYVWHVWTDGEVDMEIPDTPDSHEELAEILKEEYLTGGYEKIVIIRKGRYEGWDKNEIR